jgi:HSP20 family protein
MVFRRSDGVLAVGQLRREMDRLFGDFFGPGGTAQAMFPARGFPALNIWEQGDALLAEAEVPGVKAEDVDVSVVGAELVIKGRRGGGHPDGVSYHRRERGVGEFSRTVRLPVEVDAAKVYASLQDGILRITLPKAATAKPRKIEVNAGG